MKSPRARPIHSSSARSPTYQQALGSPVEGVASLEPIALYLTRPVLVDPRSCEDRLVDPGAVLTLGGPSSLHSRESAAKINGLGLASQRSQRAHLRDERVLTPKAPNARRKRRVLSAAISTDAVLRPKFNVAADW